MTEWQVWLVPALGSALLHFLWQGALIGLIAATVLQLLRDARPQLRYAVACVALLACSPARWRRCSACWLNCMRLRPPFPRSRLLPGRCR